MKKIILDTIIWAQIALFVAGATQLIFDLWIR